MAQAAAYIERVGFCLLFPIKGVALPSLWAEVKGYPETSGPREPALSGVEGFSLVAEWDDDALKLWEWKDELPRRRLAYSGRYFRGRKSLLSLRFLPCFYRLEGNSGVADEYDGLYREGKITADARAVCHGLSHHGPQATLELRYALGWSSPRGNARFKKAIAELQRRLLIVHWGSKAETRAWESVVYELTPRAFPAQVRAAARLTPEEARRRIATQYRKLNPQATSPQAARLFVWLRADTCAAFGLGS